MCRLFAYPCRLHRGDVAALDGGWASTCLAESTGRLGPAALGVGGGPSIFPAIRRSGRAVFRVLTDEPSLLVIHERLPVPASIWTWTITTLRIPVSVRHNGTSSNAEEHRQAAPILPENLASRSTSMSDSRLYAGPFPYVTRRSRGRAERRKPHPGKRVGRLLAASIRILRRDYPTRATTASFRLPLSAIVRAHTATLSTARGCAASTRRRLGIGSTAITSSVTPVSRLPGLHTSVPRPRAIQKATAGIA
jgi:hypothetical protein